MMKTNKKLNSSFKYSLLFAPWIGMISKLKTTGFIPSSPTLVNIKLKCSSKAVTFSPIDVAWYNAIMGGVVWWDQLWEWYAFSRNNIKWWHRIFYHLIDLGTVYMATSILHNTLIWIRLQTRAMGSILTTHPFWKSTNQKKIY